MIPVLRICPYLTPRRPHGLFRAACLCVSALLAGAQASRGVLYCVEEEAAGLSPRDGYRNPTRYAPMRFTIQIRPDRTSVAISDRVSTVAYDCHPMFGNLAVSLACHAGPWTFNLRNNDRFTWTWVYGPLAPAAVPDSEREALRVSWGTCSAF